MAEDDVKAVVDEVACGMREKNRGGRACALSPAVVRGSSEEGEGGMTTCQVWGTPLPWLSVGKRPGPRAGSLGALCLWLKQEAQRFARHLSRGLSPGGWAG